MEYTILTKAGSCRSGCDNTGTISHAVLNNGYAVCGTRPSGRSAGWSSWKSENITCSKCLKKLDEISSFEDKKEESFNNSQFGLGA